MWEVAGSSPSQARDDSEDHDAQKEKSAGVGAFILALKPMGRVNRSTKQRLPAAPQNDDLSPQKKKTKIK